MNNSELAIIFSAASLGIALFALGWNIYRDVIMKPRLRVSANRGFIASEAIETTDKFIITAVNFGPGKISLQMIWYRRSSVLRKVFRNSTQGILIHDYKNPISGKLPKTLEVGETICFMFPWDAECVLKMNPSQLGIADSFGRKHWASRREVRKANKQWKKEFGSGKKLSNN